MRARAGRGDKREGSKQVHETTRGRGCAGTQAAAAAGNCRCRPLLENAISWQLAAQAS
jgi:hypothetical protein